MAPKERAELEETFLALRRLMAAMRGRFHAALAEHELTFPQWIVLKSLDRRGSLPARELADVCGVTPANITGIVDRLVEADLVTRTRSEDDRRVVFMDLTPLGKEKVRAVIGIAERSLSSLFEGWNDKELAAFRSSLARLSLRPEDQQDL